MSEATTLLLIGGIAAGAVWYLQQQKKLAAEQDANAYVTETQAVEEALAKAEKLRKEAELMTAELVKQKAAMDEATQKANEKAAQVSIDAKNEVNSMKADIVKQLEDAAQIARNAVANAAKLEADAKLAADRIIANAAKSKTDSDAQLRLAEQQAAAARDAATNATSVEARNQAEAIVEEQMRIQEDIKAQQARLDKMVDDATAKTRDAERVKRDAEATAQAQAQQAARAVAEADAKLQASIKEADRIRAEAEAAAQVKAREAERARADAEASANAQAQEAARIRAAAEAQAQEIARNAEIARKEADARANIILQQAESARLAAEENARKQAELLTALEAQVRNSEKARADAEETAKQAAQLAKNTRETAEAAAVKQSASFAASEAESQARLREIDRIKVETIATSQSQLQEAERVRTEALQQAAVRTAEADRIRSTAEQTAVANLQEAARIRAEAEALLRSNQGNAGTIRADAEAAARLKTMEADRIRADATSQAQVLRNEAERIRREAEDNARVQAQNAENARMIAEDVARRQAADIIARAEMEAQATLLEVERVRVAAEEAAARKKEADEEAARQRVIAEAARVAAYGSMPMSDLLASWTPAAGVVGGVGTAPPEWDGTAAMLRNQPPTAPATFRLVLEKNGIANSYTKEVTFSSANTESLVVFKTMFDGTITLEKKTNNGTFTSHKRVRELSAARGDIAIFFDGEVEPAIMTKPSRAPREGDLVFCLNEPLLRDPLYATPTLYNQGYVFMGGKLRPAKNRDVSDSWGATANTLQSQPSCLRYTKGKPLDYPKWTPKEGDSLKCSTDANPGETVYRFVEGILRPYANATAATTWDVNAASAPFLDTCDTFARGAALARRVGDIATYSKKAYVVSAEDNWDVDISKTRGTAVECATVCDATPGCAAFTRPKGITDTTAAECVMKNTIKGVKREGAATDLETYEDTKKAVKWANAPKPYKKNKYTSYNYGMSAYDLAQDSALVGDNKVPGSVAQGQAQCDKMDECGAFLMPTGTTTSFTGHFAKNMNRLSTRYKQNMGLTTWVKDEQPLVEGDTVTCADDPNPGNPAYRYSNGKLKLYPSDDIAKSWNPNYVRDAKHRQTCVNLPQGPSMVQKVAVPVGQTVMCKDDQYRGGAAYRHMGDGVLRWYPTTEIATSWNPTYNTNTMTFDSCPDQGMTYGDRLDMNTAGRAATR